MSKKPKLELTWIGKEQRPRLEPRILLEDPLREEGEPLREALLGAGIARLRPVMITVGATIFGLFPLAMNGGPLWEALCYAQIGGLLLANYVTKLLVPALYAIFVLDLKLIKWHGRESAVTSTLTTKPLTTKPLS